MCGRFILLTDLAKIVEAFDIDDVACEYRPSHNIFPGQQITAVVHDEGHRLVEFKWGLIPSWAKDPSIGYKMINARAETIQEKPSFRSAFKKRRCLIVADGFYEWKTAGRHKVPLQFFLKSGEPFGFAGLYEHWTSPEGPPIDTCTIITTNANELIAPIHDRMPVILPQAAAREWMDPGHADGKRLLSLLTPYPPDEMAMRAIDPASLASR
jgi:putative SOS response-associated peptidase YedK